MNASGGKSGAKRAWLMGRGEKKGAKNSPLKGPSPGPHKTPKRKPGGPWDLTALINAADADAALPERHLWLVRLMEWLRHAPRRELTASPVPSPSAPMPLPPETLPAPGEKRTPLPVLRLRHLLNQCERQPALGDKLRDVMQAFWRDIDAASLYADFGFGARRSLASEVHTRLRERLLPDTPDTHELAALFGLLFKPEDATWVAALDAATFERAAHLLGPQALGSQALGSQAAAPQEALLEAITILVSAVHGAGFSPPLRRRMDAAALQGEPFRQLTGAASQLRVAVQERRQSDALQAAAYLRGVLDACRHAAASVMPHLEEFGVSVNIVFELEQLQARCQRIEQLVNCVIAPEPVQEARRLLADLLRCLGEMQGLRALLARHYSLLARQVAERSAESGEAYITTNRSEHRQMLRRAAGGGIVIAGTTLGKFALGAVALSAFWAGWWAGVLYAGSFVLIMLLHWTLATKQPAMTAPALASSLAAIQDAPREGEAGLNGNGNGNGNSNSNSNGARDGANNGASDASTETAIEAFVDRVAQLIRSQTAGVIGNLALCGPIVLLLQMAAQFVFGGPLVGEKDAERVLQNLTLLGPCAFYAAFTGVLLFTSSLIAGWAENWFVFHRLDSAIAWNPRIVSRLGAARAQRWSRWWRTHISGLAANVSLGLMLGLVPALAAFVGLPLEVRHVTLSTGQLAAALGALGPSMLLNDAFWWCVLGIVAIGVLNLSVSFGLAFSVALRSRGLRVRQRQRIGQALRRRFRQAPSSFFWPPKDG
jgi:site-specific recombinase